MACLAAVVVNYRTPVATARAVASMHAAQRPPDLTFVVDNASGADGVAEVAGARVLPSGVNVGFPAGANLGIRTALDAGADTVFLLNSDATVAHDCLAALERGLEAAPRCGIAGALVLSGPDPGAPVRSAGIRYAPRTGRMREQRAAPPSGTPIAVDAVSGCAMLVRRATFQRTGLLAEEYFFSFEDVEFCLRARAAGLATFLVPGAIVYHEGSASIGRRSPERLYFAARNHLLLARSAGPPGTLARRFRTAVVVALNVAHALAAADVPRTAGLLSVLRGIGDHARGRYGGSSTA